MTMPACQFIHYEKTQRITGIQEMIIWWIMAHPHRIHVHILHKQYIVDTDFFTGSPSAGGPESMTIHSFHFHFYTIYIDTISFFYFHCSKTKSLPDGMNNLAVLQQIEFSYIQVRKFGRPYGR